MEVDSGKSRGNVLRMSSEMIMEILAKGLWKWWKNAMRKNVQCGQSGPVGQNVLGLVVLDREGGLDNVLEINIVKGMIVKKRVVMTKHVHFGQSGLDGLNVLRPVVQMVLGLELGTARVTMASNVMERKRKLICVRSKIENRVQNGVNGQIGPNALPHVEVALRRGSGIVCYLRSGMGMVPIYMGAMVTLGK